ncbi:hypothetical protein EGW08_008235 [Elysia chlorotica]|uniref:FMRFamide neuropeptide n=1 Tax=Elysia chlorotica TaxID=188477 RepID=A0A433TQW0_ELYCH|nr:hypothetical protein EGW08_008235 [Elysia chlorotica]
MEAASDNSEYREKREATRSKRAINFGRISAVSPDDDDDLEERPFYPFERSATDDDDDLEERPFYPFERSATDDDDDLEERPFYPFGGSAADDDHNFNKRKFIRFGRSYSDPSMNKRFLRFGRSTPDKLASQVALQRMLAASDGEEPGSRKRRSLDTLMSEHASSEMAKRSAGGQADSNLENFGKRFMRFGRVPRFPADFANMSFHPYSKRTLTGPEFSDKRFMRFGRGRFWKGDKRFIRFGKRFDELMDKRFMRFGRSIRKAADE